jgi:hypothetical protein
MAIGYQIGGPDQIREGVRPGSNLTHWFIDEWPGVDPMMGRCSSGSGSGLTVGHHGHSPEMGGIVATGLHSL